MARFTVALDYVLRYQAGDGPGSDLAWEKPIKNAEEHRFDFRVTSSTNRHDGPAILVHTTASTDADSLDSWSLERLGTALEEAVAKSIQWWTSGMRYRHDKSVVAFANALERAHPQARVRVPLLGSDRGIVLSDREAHKTIVACVEETYPFWSDQEERLAATSVNVDGRDLVITATTLRIAVDCARAYLTARKRRAAPRQAVPAIPVWALTSATIAFISFGMSWAPLNWPTLTIFMTLGLAVAVGAVMSAPRFGVQRRTTVFGLVPILILVLFAWIYGMASLLDASVITSNGQPLHYLREPFLLALSLLTTVGILDLATHSWVRSIAYLEMLLIAGVAGGAAIVATRRLSRGARAIIDELRLERQG